MKKGLVIFMICAAMMLSYGCAHKDPTAKMSDLKNLRSDIDSYAGGVNTTINSHENRLKVAEQQNGVLNNRLTTLEQRPLPAPAVPPEVLADIADLKNAAANLGARLDQLDQKVEKVEAAPPAPVPVPAPTTVVIPESVTKSITSVQKDVTVLKKKVKSAEETAKRAEKISRQRQVMVAQAGLRYFLIGPSQGRSTELKKAQTSQVETLKKKLENENLVVIEITGLKRPIEGKDQISVAMTRAKNVQKALGDLGKEAQVMATEDTTEVRDRDANDYVVVIAVPKAKSTQLATPPEEGWFSGLKNFFLPKGCTDSPPAPATPAMDNK